MTKISREEILKQLQWRYAVKKFDVAKKVSEADWKVLEESLRLAPSSYGLQPWKFLVIRDRKILADLRAASWKQSQVEDASHFIVFLYHRKVDENWIEKYMELIADTRDIPRASLDPFYKAIVSDVIQGPRAKIADTWAQRQTYIAMGMLMETAALLEIDSCPMEGLEPENYDRILGLVGSEWGTVAACAIGYRHAEDPLQHWKKVRFPREEVIEFRWPHPE